MMSKQQARKILMIGYLIAIVGFIVGLSTEIYNEPLLSGLYMAYICWSIYHGMGLIGKSFDDFFKNMFVFKDNVFELIQSFMIKKIVVFVLKILLSMIIGFCGGALYRQVVLSRIAYY